MSDHVNISIRRWRDALACGESIKNEQLDELQDHLEAELQKIPSEGLKDEERVLLAARRVGSPDQLNKQFFDADLSSIWRRRVFWMIVGFFMLAKLPSALLSITSPLAVLALSWNAPKYAVCFGLVCTYLGVWSVILYGVLQFIQGASAKGKSGHWVLTHPTLSIILLLLALLFMWSISSFVSLLVAMNVTPDNYGQVVIWQIYLLPVVSLLVPCVLSFFALNCYRRSRIYARF